jgi:hypothetical protein
MGARAKTGRVAVRTYPAGAGACTLLSFATGGGTAHVLVDCGTGARKAVAEIAKQTGGELALIAVTQARHDRAAGFAEQAKTFRQMRVGEIWLPWTEDPDSEAAARFRERRAATLRRLKLRAARLESTLAADAAALRVLRKELGVRPRYVAAADRIESAAGIRGLTAHVLGVAREAASTGFGADGVDEFEPSENVVPFDERWHVKPKHYPYYQLIEDNESEKNKLAVAASELETLGFAIDRVVAASALEIEFHFHGERLVFPERRKPTRPASRSRRRMQGGGRSARRRARSVRSR